MESCKGYAFFGVTASNWCWCGNKEPPSDRMQAESECNINCPGDSNIKCGGPWRMSVFRLGMTDEGWPRCFDPNAPPEGKAN